MVKRVRHPEKFEMAEEKQYFPNMSAHGRKMLKWLREHPHAPRYTAKSGNKLTDEGLRRVRAFEAELRASPAGWKPDTVPDWLDDFVKMCYRDVPFYRRRSARPSDFLSIAPTTRDDLARQIWAFVPDTLPSEGMIIYGTSSSTTGHPLIVPSHPEVGASYIPLLKKALAMHGAILKSRRGGVACIMIGYQRKCFTYASVTPDLDDAGFVKLNLHLDDWHHPDDRVKFINSCNPELITGDPISYAEFAKLPLKIRPRALLSTAMTLLSGLRRKIEERFNCPVLDIYSTNESGPIAAGDGEGHILLQHRLYVEILDRDGGQCPAGERGEITLTGGFNPYLPLLRYRTGDHASLAFRGTQPVLKELEGRPPVVFKSADGNWINNVDVTHVLQPFALPQFTLHQAPDNSLTFRFRRAPVSHEKVREALLSLFGEKQKLNIEEVDSFEDKVIQYTVEKGSVEF